MSVQTDFKSMDNSTEMSNYLKELKIKLEFMQNNISEINLYLEEAKHSKSHRISQKVFDLHKETTKCAKEVSGQLKELSIGSDLNEMRTHRTLLIEFLTALSDLSSLQRLIIDKTVNNHDCVDCGKALGKKSTNSLLSQIYSSTQSYVWLLIGMAVMGGITAAYLSSK